MPADADETSAAFVPALMRPSTSEERWVVAVSTLAVAALALAAMVALNDDAPGRLAGGVALVVVAAVSALVVGRGRRIDPPDEPHFWELESCRRRALRRALIAGRPGPVADRAYARFWLGRRLRYPTNSAVQIGTAGYLLALPGGWSWLAVVPYAFLIASGAVPLLMHPHWRRLAERIDADGPRVP